MEQIVTVRALYDDGTAEIVCRRASACSGDCGHCGGCTDAQTVLARANNPIGAKPGDRVVVQSASSQVLGAAVVVYLLPLSLLLGDMAWPGAWARRLDLPWGSSWRSGWTGGGLGRAGSFTPFRLLQRILGKNHEGIVAPGVAGAVGKIE
ncbi:MAG: SoxR reducing system RseC family protein [Oscillospiraceae bacterium]